MAKKVIISLKKYDELMEDLATAQIDLKRATQDFNFSKIENVKNLAILADRVLVLDERADRYYNMLTDEQIYRLAERVQTDLKYVR